MSEWRYTCPEGHTTISPRGSSIRNGTKYYACEACRTNGSEWRYDHKIDQKTGRKNPCLRRNHTPRRGMPSRAYKRVRSAVIGMQAGENPTDSVLVCVESMVPARLVSAKRYLSGSICMNRR